MANDSVIGQRWEVGREALDERQRRLLVGVEAKVLGHTVSHVVVGKLLKAQDDSLQTDVKVLEGHPSPDRNAQFEHINTTVSTALQANQPVISVDTKKKELVGIYKNAGREWLTRGEPVKVRVHGFIDKNLGRANP